MTILRSDLITNWISLHHSLTLFSALGGGVHCSLFRGAVILPSSLVDGSSMEVLLLEEVPVRLPASAVVDVLLVPGVA